MARPPVRPARLKWHHLYFLLAAFDLFAVSLGLFLAHRLVTMHKDSVTVNLQWVARIKRADTLAKDAGAVALAGSDVLDNRDAVAESLKMETALARFNTTFGKLTNEMRHNVPAQEATPLLDDCALIHQQIDDLVGKSEFIISRIREGKFDQMGPQAASKSHEYDDVLRALDQLRADLRARRNKILEAQVADSEKLARFEWLLGGLIVLMVAGITGYGLRLQRHMSVSDAQLRLQSAALEAAADAIIITDCDGTIRWVNPAFATVTGYTREEVIGQNPRILKSGKHAAAFYQSLHAMIHSGQTWRGEIINRRKDGSLYTEEMTITPVRDGGGEISRFIAIKQDVTERKQAEEALQQAHDELEMRVRERTEQLTAANLTLQVEIAERARLESHQTRLAAMLDAAPDFVGFADATDGHLLYINKAGREMCGIGELEDVSNLKLSDVHPGWVNKMFEETILPVATREGVWRGECAFLHRDGHEIPVSMALLSHKTPDGEVEIFSTISRDITGRKQAEETLSRAHDELEMRVQERTAESAALNVSLRAEVDERKRTEEALRESNLRLQDALANLKTAQEQVIQEERLSALGTMASGIAHDFNNALTTILGYSELLLNRPDCFEDKEKARLYIEMMNAAAQDAGNVVNRLREFYRHREKTEAFAPVDLTDLVNRVITLTQPTWRAQAEARGNSIAVRTDLQAVPPVAANASELREALTNLIFNAVDAMPRGGTITIRTRAADSHVTLEVSDTGTGMTEEIRRRCLEPFFTTKGERGTGLGLSLVYGILQRHQGTVDIETEVGKGTTFIIRLPAQSAQPPSEPPATPPSAARQLHVLVVDDEAVVRKIIGDYLKIDGHIVEVANGGRDGLEKFHNSRFDLVLLDRAMPDMSGDQVAAVIKSANPAVPVIMLTGFGSMMNAADEKPPGVDFIVGKPVTIDALRAALSRAVASVNPPTDPTSRDQAGLPRDDHEFDLAEVNLDKPR